jgi:hypothetical protein
MDTVRDGSGSRLTAGWKSAVIAALHSNWPFCAHSQNLGFLAISQSEVSGKPPVQTVLSNASQRFESPPGFPIRESPGQLIDN